MQTDLTRGLRVLAWCAGALICSTATPEDSLVRVTCRGVFRLSVTEPALQCGEDDMLTDPDGGLMSAFSAATVDLASAELKAGAAGGAIRDVGYIGREASSLMLETWWLDGDWQGPMPVTISLRIRYGFGGYGEGRLVVHLRSSTTGSPRGDNHAGVRMSHTELGGAALIEDTTAGNYALPQPGTYPASSSLDLSVIQLIEPHDAVVEVRADLYVFAFPSLTTFDSTISALVNAEAELGLSAPCPVEVRTTTGARVAKVVPQPSDDSWRCGSAPEPVASVP